MIQKVNIIHELEVADDSELPWQHHGSEDDPEQHPVSAEAVFCEAVGGQGSHVSGDGRVENGDKKTV